MCVEPFLTHGEWVMGGLTLAYVIVSIVYVIISGRTLQAVKRQSDNLDRTLALQEAGMRQWVELGRWATDNPDQRNILNIHFQIVNKTPTPLTLDGVFIRVGGQRSDTSIGRLLIPGTPFVHVLPMQLTSEQVTLFVDDNLIVSMECTVAFTDALNIKWQQLFGYLLQCKITYSPIATESKNTIQPCANLPA